MVMPRSQEPRRNIVIGSQHKQDICLIAHPDHKRISENRRRSKSSASNPCVLIIVNTPPGQLLRSPNIKSRDNTWTVSMLCQSTSVSAAWRGEQETKVSIWWLQYKLGSCRTGRPRTEINLDLVQQLLNQGYKINKIREKLYVGTCAFLAELLRSFWPICDDLWSAR